MSELRRGTQVIDVERRIGEVLSIRWRMTFRQDFELPAQRRTGLSVPGSTPAALESIVDGRLLI
jgi:hypothetical protein